MNVLFVDGNFTTRAAVYGDRGSRMNKFTSAKDVQRAFPVISRADGRAMTNLNLNHATSSRLGFGNVVQVDSIVLYVKTLDCMPIYLLWFD